MPRPGRRMDAKKRLETTQPGWRSASRDVVADYRRCGMGLVQTASVALSKLPNSCATSTHAEMTSPTPTHGYARHLFSFLAALHHHFPPRSRLLPLSRDLI